MDTQTVSKETNSAHQASSCVLRNCFLLYFCIASGPIAHLEHVWPWSFQGQNGTALALSSLALLKASWNLVHTGGMLATLRALLQIVGVS